VVDGDGYVVHYSTMAHRIPPRSDITGNLIEDGQVAGYGRAGPIVVAVPAAAPNARVDTASPSPPSPEELFAPRPSSEIFDLLRTVPARIDLSPGVPDLAAFPRAARPRAERSVLGDVESSNLGYGDPRGRAPAAPRGRDVARPQPRG
jgi:GntR family transcriptional regulator/MocR family aminotransferase